MQSEQAPDPQVWEQVLTETPQPESGLQSPEWGELKQGTGWTPHRFAVGDRTLSQVLVRRLPMGVTVAYAPRGPIWRAVPDRGSLEGLLQQITDTIKPTFLRFDPCITDPAIAGWLREIGFRKSFEEIQPDRTMIVSLAESEEEILARMHQKGRYNIRLAQRHGVSVEESGADGIADFGRLLAETAKRDGIRVQPLNYFERQLELLGSHGELLVARRDGEVVAGIIVEYRGRYATYLHGASSGAGQRYMPSYLIQWEAIRRAKDRGHEGYDLRGVGPEDEPRHPYAGLRTFKSKFGGEERHYIGAYDLVFDRTRYQIYRSGQKTRRMVGRFI